MNLDEQPQTSQASYDSSDSSGAHRSVGGGSTWWVFGLEDWNCVLVFCSNHFEPSSKRLGGVARARDAVTQVTEYGANGISCWSPVNTHTIASIVQSSFNISIIDSLETKQSMIETWIDGPDIEQLLIN